jgi:hypothetical protein
MGNTEKTEEQKEKEAFAENYYKDFASLRQIPIDENTGQRWSDFHKKYPNGAVI